MPVGDKASLPLIALHAARVEVGQTLVEQAELVLVIAGLGVFVQLLQQYHIRLLGTDHPRNLIEGERQVFRGGAGIAALALVVPEHIALAGQVLHVPAHHFQRLAGLQEWRRVLTGDW